MTTAPFDTHAAGYDAVAETVLGRVLRDRVHHVLYGLITPGDEVVDIGCGTGIDASWLAPQVRSVHAVDSSAEMVDLTRTRCAKLSNVTVAQRDVGLLTLQEPVDVVLANFGVVNCVGDLPSFGQRMHDWLRPGGHAVLVTMARYCPVELAIGVATANRSLLRRRQATASGTSCDYGDLAVRYASAKDLQTAFGDQLSLVSAESLGLVLPPYEQRRWVQDRPGLSKALAAADRHLGWFGARVGLGDHHIAVFQRRR